MNNQNSSRAIIFSLLSFVYAYGIASQASNLFHHDFSTISKIFIFILGWIGAFGGQFVGIWVKDKLKPDIIIAENQTDIWKHHLLWFLVPPFLGGLIGAFLGAMIWILPASWIVGFPLTNK